MDASQLQSMVKSSYDRLAGKYAEVFWSELSHKPFDVKLLDAFAKSIPAGGTVADLGCGPCQIGRFLRDRGLRVVGIDLSATMLIKARSLNPDVSFACQDLRALAVRPSSLEGAVAFFSLVHLLPDGIRQALNEIRLGLAPGGTVLLAMHGGSGHIQVESMLGEPVPMYVTLVDLQGLCRDVKDAGLTVVDAVARPPYEVEYPTERLFVRAERSA